MSPFNLKPGEKYGLIIIPGIQISESLQNEIQLAPDLWVFRKADFGLADTWKKWLGSLKTASIENADLFLISKGQSTYPKVLDYDNEGYKRRVFNFYMGLLISTATLFHDTPFIITGAHLGQEIDVRQVGDYKTPQHIPGSPYHTVELNHLEKAANLAESMGEVQGKEKYFRFIRVIRTFYEGVVEVSVDRQLHQFVRCIEGLILPVQGSTKKQFLSRTELFIGPRHHELMSLLFDIRSAVEHMHDPRHYLPVSDDKEGDVIIFKKAMESESIARYCINRILSRKSLWGYFKDDRAIESFWKMDSSGRNKLWGDHLNIDQISKNFNREEAERLRG